MRRGGRNGAGRNEHSWIKHDLIRKALGGQVGAYRFLHPSARILLIDGNAGDGVGVKIEQTQFDFFAPPPVSRPTPQLLVELAQSIGNADVVLCELDRYKRKELWRRYPGTRIVGDNIEALNAVHSDHQHAFWLSDPCGPKGHCVDNMYALDRRVPCDFVVAFNEHPIKRMLGTQNGWTLHRERYGPMLEPTWWLTKLRKHYLARSRVINLTQNFHFRVLVIADFIADSAKRDPFGEIITAPSGRITNGQGGNISHPLSSH